MILDKKVIIVTGGSGLLGREIIKDITSKGGIAINVDIGVETNLKNRNIKADITSEISVEETISLVYQNFGKIDGLVNNAYPRTEDWGAVFEEIQYSTWQKNVDMQMNAVFLFIQKIAPYLIESKGSVVSMASIYGVVGNDMSLYENTKIKTAPAYTAIKGGLLILHAIYQLIMGARELDLTVYHREVFLIIKIQYL
ncbi:SDR family NAD(P)-dependent oxidoreductase [Kaistella antarctica]|uniref:Rhamnolipids biosynthesis 3-oxoacyl-[acyl-carrier-protein] reductase n=1 Tax=Kaistella antarctica TaxID=266748 RepID=A0A448NRE3_9FLAO|nr:SDR family NAD(P)-dependent oxidoreductase [Kaistella antarctica]VEH99436.1 Rhamnolipids biosynthesis 3-oxoacyl-[acyl-carrier-protein] reductase [Kaistella antarctica]